jgi:hypothetical protein
MLAFRSSGTLSQPAASISFLMRLELGEAGEKRDTSGTPHEAAEQLACHPAGAVEILPHEEQPVALSGVGVERDHRNPGGDRLRDEQERARFRPILRRSHPGAGGPAARRRAPRWSAPRLSPRIRGAYRSRCSRPARCFRTTTEGCSGGARRSEASGAERASARTDWERNRAPAPCE